MSLSALKAWWRANAAIKVGQIWRFLRVSVSVLVAQLVAEVTVNGDLAAITHLDQKAVVALAAGAAETAWRQLHPVVTVSDATQVPTPLEGGTTAVSTLPPALVPAGNITVSLAPASNTVTVTSASVPVTTPVAATDPSAAQPVLPDAPPAP